MYPELTETARRVLIGLHQAAQRCADPSYMNNPELVRCAIMDAASIYALADAFGRTLDFEALQDGVDSLDTIVRETIDDTTWELIYETLVCNVL